MDFEQTREELAAVSELLAKLRRQVKRLLDQVGDEGECKGCGATIYWVRHKKSGKAVPYTPEALNHFADCPKAQSFR